MTVRRRVSVPSTDDLERPVRIEQGLLAVQVLNGTVRIPAGGIWPGLGEVPDWLRPQLSIMHVTAVTGTVWTAVGAWGLSDAALRGALALVQAQLLGSGSTHARVALGVQWYGDRLTDLTHEEASVLLDMSRESFTKAHLSLRRSGVTLSPERGVSP